MPVSQMTLYTPRTACSSECEKQVTFLSFINSVNDFWFCHSGIDSGPWLMWWVTPWPRELWLISAGKTLSKKGSRWENARIHQWIDLVQRVTKQSVCVSSPQGRHDLFPSIFSLVWKADSKEGRGRRLLWLIHLHAGSLMRRTIPLSIFASAIRPSWLGTAGLVPLEQLQKGNSALKAQFIAFFILMSLYGLNIRRVM